MSATPEEFQMLTQTGDEIARLVQLMDATKTTG